MTDTPGKDKPTIVLVHGAFADASSWNGVDQTAPGSRATPVVAPANPLRGIAADSAYIANSAQPDRCPGAPGRPLLRRRCDHERRHRPRERHRPRLRRRLRPRRRRAPDRSSRATRRTASSTPALVPRQYPTGERRRRRRNSPSTHRRFRDAFAGDLDDEQVAWMEPRSGRSPNSRSPSHPGRRPGRTCPSWAVVATGDQAAGADVVRSMAVRAGAKITEIDGSHVIMISQPEAVTTVIMEAVAEAAAAPEGA